MDCHHFAAGRCRSCTWLERSYDAQVADKQAATRELLAAWPTLEWLPPVRSAEQGFRNKAKMVVSGAVEAPVLGILDRDAVGIDLADCGLYPSALASAFEPLARFVTLAALTPYDVPSRRGELKHLLVTVAPDRDLMVRFVLRSTESLSRIRKHLPTLQEWLPGLRVASVNLQPAHKAVLEGDDEVLLTAQESLTMPVNDIELHLRPQSFFQTNTEVAAALYRQVRDWVDDAQPASVLDLYCGVGGFALHCAGAGRAVVGVEVSEEAVASARATAASAGVEARFVAADATAYALALTEVPDLVVVNPPRRGIGADLAGWLERSGVQTVVYSSCNAVTLARDLAAMPSLRPVRARLLDMFPHTGHHEVAVHLTRTVKVSAAASRSARR